MASYAAKSVQFGVDGTGMAREKSLSEIRQPTVPDALLKFPFDIRTGCLQGPMQNDSRIGIGLIFRYKGLQARLAKNFQLITSSRIASSSFSTMWCFSQSFWKSKPIALLLR